MADFYCPRCMVTGEVHSDCDATGVSAEGVGRFANATYTTAQLKCRRCGHLFWSARPDALKLLEQWQQSPAEHV